VELVYAQDAVDGKDGAADIFERDARRNTLEEDEGGGANKWQGRGENNDSDNERDGGIEIEAGREGGEPNEKSCRDDTDVAELRTHTSADESSG
jgi:hypothetical protein